MLGYREGGGGKPPLLLFLRASISFMAMKNSFFTLVLLSGFSFGISSWAGDEVYDGQVKPKDGVDCLKNDDGECLTGEELEEAQKKAIAELKAELKKKKPKAVAPKAPKAPKIPKP